MPSVEADCRTTLGYSAVEMKISGMDPSHHGPSASKEECHDSAQQKRCSHARGEEQSGRKECWEN
jgi:hypothetical protein